MGALQPRASAAADALRGRAEQSGEKLGADEKRKYYTVLEESLREECVRKVNEKQRRSRRKKEGGGKVAIVELWNAQGITVVSYIPQAGG